jgi:hypothetical protein
MFLWEARWPHDRERPPPRERRRPEVSESHGPEVYLPRPPRDAQDVQLGAVLKSGCRDLDDAAHPTPSVQQMPWGFCDAQRHKHTHMHMHTARGHGVLWAPLTIEKPASVGTGSRLFHTMCTTAPGTRDRTCGAKHACLHKVMTRCERTGALHMGIVCQPSIPGQGRWRPAE